MELLRPSPRNAATGLETRRKQGFNPCQTGQMPITFVRKSKIEQDAILEAAANMESSIAAAFLRAVEAIKGTINMTKLTEALAAHDSNEVLAVLALDKGFADALMGKGLAAGVQSFRDALQATYAAGAKAAINQLPSKVSLNLSFNLMSPEAVNHLASYDFGLIQQISGQTKEAIRDIIMRAFNVGGSPAQQAREIRDVIGLTANQEKAVANYREMLEQGNLREAMTRALRDGRFDRTVLRAAQNKSPLAQAQVDKMVARYNERFINYRATTIARTECLLAETLVDGAMVRAAFRRWYDGPMVEIVTSSGRKISATPNHPMLTQRGWIGAGEITERDYLICDASKQNVFKNFDVQTPPSSLAEIFNTLTTIGIGKRELGRRPDFHGDGRESEVNTFSASRTLPVGRFSPLNQPIINKLFSPTNFGRTRFCKFCGALLPINKFACFCNSSKFYTSSLQVAANCLIERLKFIAERTQAFASEVARLNFVDWQIFTQQFNSVALVERFAGGAAITRRNISLLEDSAYRRRIDSNLFGNGVGASAGEIELDNVRAIKIRPFVGHVYNLETPYGYFTISGGAYTGNSIRASNKGQQEVWRQSLNQGLIPSNIKRVWIVSGDDATCEICSALDGMTAAVGEEFDDGILEPPDPHPNCRCSTGLDL